MRTQLPATAAAGRLARDALDGWLSTLLGDVTAGDVRSATSELVTNAVLHGGLPNTDTIDLSCTVDDRLVRVEVGQRSSAAGARIVPAAERQPADGGFGLRIVDGVSSRWDVDDGPPGRVWFEVER
jgi:anti-sigma regulatory factor (Ser/Thr protein kinase)